jgi:hypothetical protein
MRVEWLQLIKYKILKKKENKIINRVENKRKDKIRDKLISIKIEIEK